MNPNEIKDSKLRARIIAADAVQNRRVERPKSRVSVVCKCGKSFEAYASHNRKYCSLDCAYSSEERNFRPIKNRGTRLCVGCGVEYALTTQNQDTKYCSHDCFTRCVSPHLMRANRKKSIRNECKWTNLNCEHCGKPFQRRKLQVIDGKHVYCSIPCAVNGGCQLRGVITRIKTGKTSPQHIYSRSKRGWRNIGDRRVFFRSRMEANYARFLSFLRLDWKYEPRTFIFDGIKRGVVSYLPDFYIPSEDRYVECKGWMDKRSKTKLRRMTTFFPEVKVTLFDWKQYKAIERTIGKCIPEWEF